MGYYTIRLDPDASKICTIIFPRGKYSYKESLPMGIAGSPDIFQGKMLELMGTLEYVRAYLDDLLCISKLSLDDHLEKLEEVLRQLCYAGLKVNAAKSTFCALEIDFLVYVLTRDDIVLGRQANLMESSKSRELAELWLQVIVVVMTSDACEIKKEIMRLKSDLQK
jgi:hypothetical protein